MAAHMWVKCPKCSGKFDVHTPEFHCLDREMLCPWCKTFFKEKDAAGIWLSGLKPTGFEDLVLTDQ